MSGESEHLLLGIKERFCPPRGMYYVIHSVSHAKATSSGSSLEETVKQILDIGVIAPADYSVITLKYDEDWIESGNGKNPVMDFIFHTESKPTDEPDAAMDSLYCGFPLRDPVQPFPLDAVPPSVRAMYPNSERFVVVPQSDLSAVILWQSEESRTVFNERVHEVTKKVINGQTNRFDGLADMSRIFLDAPMLLVNGDDRQTIVHHIAENTLRVGINKRDIRDIFIKWVENPQTVRLPVAS